MHGASVPVVKGCFCPSFLVRLTSAYNTVNSWDPPVTPDIQMGSTPWWPWSMLCTSVHQSCILPWFICLDIEFTQSNIPDLPFPLLAGGRVPLVLVTVYIIHLSCMSTRRLIVNLKDKTRLFSLSGRLLTGNWSYHFPGRALSSDHFSLWLM